MGLGDCELWLPFARRIAGRAASLIPAPFVPVPFVSVPDRANLAANGEDFGDHDLTAALQSRELGLLFAW
jgi:hypothetical protein